MFVQTPDGLTALDPPTGRPLWVREGLRPGCYLIGAGRHLFVVEPTVDGKPAAGHVFLKSDGSRVKAPDFGPLFEKRLKVVGRTLVLFDQTRQGVALRSYDLLTGKDRWKRTAPAGSLAMQGPGNDLVGLFEKEGKVRVFEADSGKEVLIAKVQARDLDKVEAVHLLADSRRIYLAFKGPDPPILVPFGGTRSNLMLGFGTWTLPVNGRVWAFDRASGKLRWSSEVPNQQLVAESAREWPLLLFVSRSWRWEQTGTNRQLSQVTNICAVNKTTGKLLLDRQEAPADQPFHTLHVDPRKGLIELTGFNVKVRFVVQPDGPKP